MRGTFLYWRLRVKRYNWSRGKLARRGIRPDWRVEGPRDKNMLLHRVVWRNPDGSIVQ